MELAMSKGYGRCSCGGAFAARVVQVNMSPGSEQVSVSGVPQGACPICGSRVYKVNILAGLEEMFRGGSVQSA